MALYIYQTCCKVDTARHPSSGPTGHLPPGGRHAPSALSIYKYRVLHFGSTLYLCNIVVRCRSDTSRLKLITVIFDRCFSAEAATKNFEVHFNFSVGMLLGKTN